MIAHLNPLSFGRYGNILPDRKGAAESAEIAPYREILQLPQEEIPVYTAAQEVWVYSYSGMTVLSAALPGEEFTHFYLDKIVCLRPGIRFALSALNGPAQAALWGGKHESGERIRSVHELTLQRRISISRIYGVFYLEREKGFVYPGAAHKPLELIYVDKGSIHSVADGKDILLNQGDLLFYGPDQWHMQYADEDVAASYVSISFDVDGSCPVFLFNRRISIGQHALMLLQWMIREQEKSDAYSSDIIISMLQGLLLLILREQAAGEPVKLRSANSVNSENDVIRRAQQFVSEHIRCKISVPDVAAHVEVSASYLTALFRKNLQISPAEYIRRVKLNESKRMIREGHMNFTQIAAELQYSTVHHFSRQFKDHFGLTPTEYGRSVR